MRVKLVNKKVVIQDCDFLEKKDTLVVIEGDLKNYTVGVKINNLPASVVKDGCFTIKKGVLSSDELVLEITLNNLQNNETTVYKSDKIKLKDAVLLGESYHELFPGSLKKIEEDIEKIYQQLGRITSRLNTAEEEIETIKTEGDLIV